MAEMVLTRTDGKVAILQLNRPEVLNALSLEMMKSLVDRLEAFDLDPQIYVIVIAGSEKAFAAA